MRSIDHPSQLRSLIERLAESRTRLERRRALVVASRAGLLAGSVLLLLKLGGYLAPGSAALIALGGGWAYLVAGLTLAAGLAWTAVHVRRTSPSLTEVARLADGHFGMDERWSTAVEFGGSSSVAEPPSPVLAALYQDAADRADRLDPRGLVPIRAPRTAVALACVLLSVLALELVPGPPRIPADTAAAARGRDADDPAATAELLLQTAALLRQEAESRGNEYMRVVASAMEALALDITEQRIAGDELSSELARLVAHAELALGGPVVESAAGRTTEAASAESLEWHAGADPADASGSAQREEDRDRSGRTAMAQAGGRTMENDSRVALQNLQDRLSGDQQSSDRLAGDPPSGSSSEAMEATSDPSQLGGSGSDEGEGERLLAQMLADAEGSGEGSIGEGGSQQQGIGGGALAGIPETSELQQASSSRDFHLPTDGGSRRRMPNEIVPETRLSAVEEVEVGRGSWRSSAQPRVSQDPVGISYRSIASRYFLLRNEEAAEAAP